MDIDPLNKAGRTSWIIAIATLVAIAIVQVYQIVAATDAALLIDLPHRKYMHRLAWLALAVLSVELVVLFWLAVLFSNLSCFVGLVLSYHFDVPSGATIVLVATALFFLCLLFSPKRRGSSA